VSDRPPPEDLLASVALRVDQLREAGASVVLSPEPMAPDVLGTLSQQMPNGPLLVQVDATKPLAHQLSMLAEAFEFVFDEPPGLRWAYRSVSTPAGQVLTFRTFTVRVGR
jgi:hypothetical protein